MRPHHRRILGSMNTLKSLATQQLAGETNTNIRVEQLESGAIVLSSAVVLPEKDEPSVVEAFFPANPDAYPSIMGEYDGTMRILPRKQFPQVVALLLADIIQQ